MKQYLFVFFTTLIYKLVRQLMCARKHLLSFSQHGLIKIAKPFKGKKQKTNKKKKNIKNNKNHKNSKKRYKHTKTAETFKTCFSTVEGARDRGGYQRTTPETVDLVEL